jgi:deoxyuridine 5'-triphosphate nucleotidohydrolase
MALSSYLAHNIKYSLQNNHLIAYTYSHNENEADTISNFFNLPCEVHELENTEDDTEGYSYTHCVIWRGPDVFDIANTMGNTGFPFEYPVQTFYFQKSHPEAHIPQKAHVSDSGYDLTLIEFKKENEFGIQFFGTGIKVQPPYGHYFELVPRSSMSKIGFVLANSIGIIDQSYRGEIIVALHKIHHSAEIVLPCKCVQLIPKKFLHMNMREIPGEDDFGDTIRGSGGFGSSDA